MKCLIVLVGLSFSLSGFSSSMDCKVTSGEYLNDSLKVKALRLESSAEIFSMISADSLIINVFGQEEVFQVTSRTTSGNSSKIDYSLGDGLNSVKAVLLLDRAYGRVIKKFKGLLIVSGLNFSAVLENGAPVLGNKSLVYNISCEK